MASAVPIDVKSPPRATNHVLAEWTLAPYEWRAYVQGEATERRLGAPCKAAIGAVAGAMIAGIFSMESQSIAAGAVVVGLAVFAGTLISAARLGKREPSADGAVVVRGDAVEIDGVTTVLRGDDRRLSGAKLRDDLPLPVVELSVNETIHERGHRRRTVKRVVRVPVPRGREADARRIADELVRGGGAEDA